MFSPIRWRDGALELLDQTLLPARESWLRCDRPEQVAAAIKRLSVRGAPAIGLAAAYGLVLAMRRSDEFDDLQSCFAEAHALLAATRPTAVNLSWALERGREVFERAVAGGGAAVEAALLALADDMVAAQAQAERRIGEHGAALFSGGDRVLTHCNAGALATAGYGTAGGVIRAAFEAGRIGEVLVDETRPLLQGSRLTAWELDRAGIPYRITTDNSVGALMARGLVDRVVVGADRIAANGDVANKIGTYTVAVLAHRHGVPFYVAAPLSTIDAATLSGREIPIEERDPLEVTTLAGVPVAPAGSEALNLAFDVTPAALVTAIVTEVGVLEAPYKQTIAAALAGAAARARVGRRAKAPE